MWLRLCAITTVVALTGLGVCLGWLLLLPTQPGFAYDEGNQYFSLLSYVDFVFLLIVALTIVLIIIRPYFQTALCAPNLTRFDRYLFSLMYNLPLILICLQCAVIIFVVFAVSLSLGVDFSAYDWQPS